MIKRLDEALGRLLDALKSLGLLDDTIILFTSDHGCHFKTRNAEYKRSCHESSIRVPTAIAGPGFNGGGRLRQLVSLLDLPPTLLDAAGIPVPATMQGRSILPLLRGNVAEWPEEVFVQISEAQIGRAIRTTRWKYSVSVPGANGNSAPGSDQYVEEFLYDLEADPHELTNLVQQAAYSPLKAELRERLLARMVAAGEKAPTIEPAAEQPSGQRNPEIAAIRARHIG
ncbi:MAG: sulfatase-like hydrolase/transferase [Caldilineaceae bacterium]|nr:sulfatase-like hydrolase/transferase [Caldilineaceae bacterium]